MMKCDRIRRGSAVLLAAGVMTLAGSGLVSAAAGDQVISKGILVEGVDVGGMTVKEASAAIENKVKEMGETTLTLVMGDEPITATFNDLGLKWNNREILEEIRNLGTTGSIVQRYMDQKDLAYNTQSYDLTFTLDRDKAESFLSGCSSYNSEPVDGELYISDEGVPAVSGGTDGITLKVNESVGTVTEAVESWQGGELSVDLDVDRVAPDISRETLSVVTDVLGTATTDYSASSWARATNVENGCAKINGTLLWPGEYFSVTEAVTPFTAENGYEPAPTYEENRVVDAYGGGICQVSTTLYNAVLKAELEVTARSNHTMVVSYVPLSKDAAIAEGNMDMAFVNTTDYPIYIWGYTYYGNLTFTIFGHETRPANRTLELVSETTSVTEPTGIKMYANPNQNIGYMDQTQSSHTGYTAVLWKNIYYDGVLTDTVQVNSSSYEAVAVAYDIGVASSNPALTQAMYAAIGNGDLNTVQLIISGAYAVQTETQADTTQTDTTQADTTQGDTGQTTDPSQTADTGQTAEQSVDADQTWTGEDTGEVSVEGSYDNVELVDPPE